MDKQTSPAHSGREPFASFELEGSAAQTGRRRYEGPCRDAVYSPVPAFDPGQLVGDSAAFERVRNTIDVAVQNDLNLLLQGESGTGKNLVARTIHSRSERSENWLIVVNCELIGARDLDSLLLGPSDNSAEGVFEAALGGTVVLDHVDTLDFDAQARLNHILETHSFRHLGGSGSAVFDVRLVGLATPHLPQESFKDDLYYKLSQFPIHLPPLRSRSGDVVRLARHFLRRRAEREEANEELSLSAEAEDVLREHSWTGNVRELRNAIERAATVADAPTIEASDFLQLSPQGPSSHDPAAPASQSEAPEEEHAEEESPFVLEASESIPKIEEMKREAVKRAYDLCDGNVDQAAVELGIGRSTMYRLLKRYGIK